MNRIPSASNNRGTVRAQSTRVSGRAGAMHLVNLPEGGEDDEFVLNPAETLNRPNVVDDLDNVVATPLDVAYPTEQAVPQKWDQDAWDLAFRGQYQIKRQAVAQTVARGTVLLYADSNLDGFVDDTVASPLGFIVYLTKTHKLRVDDYIIKTSLVSSTGNYGRLSNFRYPKGTWKSTWTLEDCKSYGRKFETITNDGDQTNTICLKPVVNSGLATMNANATLNNGLIVPQEMICIVDEPPRSTYSENPGDYTFLAFLEFGSDFRMTMPDNTLYLACQEYFAQFPVGSKPNIPIYQTPQPSNFSLVGQDLVVGSRAYPNPSYSSVVKPGSNFPELEGGIGVSFSIDDTYCYLPMRWVYSLVTSGMISYGWMPIYAKGDYTVSYNKLWHAMLEVGSIGSTYNFDGIIIAALKKFYDSVKVMRFDGKDYWQTEEMKQSTPKKEEYPNGTDTLAPDNNPKLILTTDLNYIEYEDGMHDNEVAYVWLLCTTGSSKTWYGWPTGLNDEGQIKPMCYFPTGKFKTFYLSKSCGIARQVYEVDTQNEPKVTTLQVESFPKALVCAPVNVSSVPALKGPTETPEFFQQDGENYSWYTLTGENDKTSDLRFHTPRPPKDVNFISGKLVQNQGELITITAEAGQQSVNHSYNSLTLSNSSVTTTTTIGSAAIPSKGHYDLIQFCTAQLGSSGTAMTFELVDMHSNKIATCYFSYSDGLAINATTSFMTLVLAQLHVVNVQTNPVSVAVTDTSNWDAIIIKPETHMAKGFYDFALSMRNAEEQMMAIGGALGGLGSGLSEWAGMENSNRQKEKDRELQERLTMEGYQNYLRRIEEQGAQDRRLQELRFENALASGGAIKGNHLQRTPYTEGDSQPTVSLEGGLYRNINGEFDSVANNSQLHGNVYDAEMENARKKKLPVTDRPGLGSTRAMRVSGPDMATVLARTPVQQAAGRVNQRNEISTVSSFGPRAPPIKVGPRVGRSANKNGLPQRSNTLPQRFQGWKSIKLNGPLQGVPIGDVTQKRHYVRKLNAGLKQAEGRIQTLQNPTQAIKTDNSIV